MDTSLLIPGLIFVLVMLLASLLFHYWNLHAMKKGVSERISKEATAEDGHAASGNSKWTGFFLQLAGGLGNTVRPRTEEDVSKIGKKLLKAGYQGKNASAVFFGTKGFLGLVLLAFFLVLKFTVLNSLTFPQILSLAIIFTVSGFYIPDLYVYHVTEKRKKILFEGFPDALDLMVVCVEAGMGLDAAIKRVGDEMALKNKVLSDEFKKLSLELRAGKTKADALRNLALRTDLEEVSSLVTLLIQTDKFGTTVGQALRVHSDSMRTKRYQKAEELAAKLPVKMVFPLIFFIFPSLFVAIVGPAAIRIYRVIINP